MFLYFIATYWAMYCLMSLFGTVHILYIYCTYTVHILYIYCTYTVHILYITLAYQTICHITLSFVNNLICLFPVVQYITQALHVVIGLKKISSRRETPHCCLGQCKIGAIHKGLFMPSYSSEGSKYGVTLLDALSWTNILHVANLFTQLNTNSLKFRFECCWHSFLC